MNLCDVLLAELSVFVESESRHVRGGAETKGLLLLLQEHLPLKRCLISKHLEQSCE